MNVCCAHQHSQKFAAYKSFGLLILRAKNTQQIPIVKERKTAFNVDSCHKLLVLFSFPFFLPTRNENAASIQVKERKNSRNSFIQNYITDQIPNQNNRLITFVFTVSICVVNRTRTKKNIKTIEIHIVLFSLSQFVIVTIPLVQTKCLKNLKIKLPKR